VRAANSLGITHLKICMDLMRLPKKEEAVVTACFVYGVFHDVFFVETVIRTC